MGYWLVDRRPSSADDAMPALILLTNWCYTKMASREIIIISILYLIVMHTGPNRGLSAGQEKVRPEEKVKKRYLIV